MVDAPFLGICAAVHMEELMSAIGVEDPLGLRERLLIIYERPRFVRSSELQEACSRIPAQSLHAHLATHFWALHCVHHPQHPPKSCFVADLNYHWLKYSWQEDAAKLFWDNFDDRAGEQEAAYRLDQQAAKRAGKWKTRHFRLALPFHNLAQACARTSIEDWNTEVSYKAAKASLIFSTWMDDVFQRLDLLRAAPLPPPGPAAAAAPSPREDLRTLLASASLGAVLSNQVNLPHLRIFMLAVLASEKRPLLRNHDVLHLKPVLALNLQAAAGIYHSNRALKALSLLGFGVVTLSTNTSGTKVLWFTKIPSEDYASPALQRSRSALAILEPNGFISWNRAQILQNKQKNQEAIVYPDLAAAEVPASIAAAATVWEEITTAPV